MGLTAVNSEATDKGSEKDKKAPDNSGVVAEVQDQQRMAAALPADNKPAGGTLPARGETLSQELLPQGQNVCRAVVGELDRLSGKPLLSLVDKNIDPDIARYRLKQPNEAGGGTGQHEKTDPESFEIGHMREGIYGQRGEAVDKTQDPTKMRERPEYFKDMQEVFGQSGVFNLMRNHNSVLSSGRLGLGGLIKAAQQREDDQFKATSKAIGEKPNEDTVLINFDAHSDAWSGPVPKGKESIAQWVNGLVRENPNIKEYYWVVPDDFKSNPDVREKYFEHKGPVPQEDSVFVHQPAHMQLYLNKQNGELITTGKPKDYSADKYNELMFHKVTIDELPNMKGKRVAASIDLDYFDNRGYDTSYDATAQWKGEAGFQRFVKELKDKDVRPIYTTVSASPEYVRNEHMADLLRFSTLVADATKPKMDAVVVPKENNVYTTGGGNDGMQINRTTRPRQLLYELFKVDSESAAPSQSIDLNKPGPKLDRAMDATKKLFNTDEAGARKILGQLDKADGKDNGVVEFESIEALMLRVCRNIPDAPLKKNPMR